VKILLRSPFSDGYEAAKRLEERGGAIFGTPEDALEERIGKLEALFGGCGTILCFVHDWAPRDKMLKSYDLLARYVMPRCQGLVRRSKHHRTAFRSTKRY